MIPQIKCDLYPTYLINQIEFVYIRDLSREQLASNVLQFTLWLAFLLGWCTVLQNKKYYNISQGLS